MNKNYRFTGTLLNWDTAIDNYKRCKMCSSFVVYVYNLQDNKYNSIPPGTNLIIHVTVTPKGIQYSSKIPWGHIKLSFLSTAEFDKELKCSDIITLDGNVIYRPIKCRDLHLCFNRQDCSNTLVKYVSNGIICINMIPDPKISCYMYPLNYEENIEAIYNNRMKLPSQSTLIPSKFKL